MTTTPPRTPPAPHLHTAGGHCEHCGSALQVEHRYDLKDRFARALLAAVCRTMGLQPYARSKRPNAPIYVRGPDGATLDRMFERFTTLLPQMDDRLLEVTRAFIKEHCGLDSHEPPRG